MPTVWMLCGPVCVGKSTFIGRMKFGTQAVLIGTDQYIEFYATLNSKTYNEVFFGIIKEAEAQMNDDVVSAIFDDKNIIWDQTNLTNKIRTKKLKVFEETDYHKVGVFFVNATKELIMSRNNRPGKIIPEDVVDRMLATYEVPAGNELGPFDEMWFVDAVTGEVTYKAV